MNLNRRLFLSSALAASLGACTSVANQTAGLGAGSNAPPDATALAEMIRKGDITASEAVEAAIARAEAAQPKINFMVSDTFADARATARGELTGPFAGVPFLVKDLNNFKGAVTREGTRATRGRAPADHDQPIVAAMRKAGFVTIGKSASPEFGYLPTTEPLAFGPTRNPWNTTRSSGGSSGGSAAAVAAGVTPIAHANDGGGSIRFPAANCGLFGLKPSRGRMYDEGGDGPLDIAVQGCVSRSVRDTARFFAATEETREGAPYAPVGLVSAPGTKRLKVGVLLKTFKGADPDPEVALAVHQTAQLLKGLGNEVRETAWPMDQGFPDDFLAFWSLGAAMDAKAVGEALGRAPTDQDLEPFSLAMASNAAKMSPDDIQGVQKRLLKATADYDGWIAGFDVVVSPVFAAPPRPLGYFRGDVPFEELRERLIRDVGYTLIHNVSGAPAMSVPLGWSSDGLPIGVQVGAGRGEERKLLELAFELEAAQPWAGRRPAVWVG
ncbi:MAG: amidase [Hyphomonadaceae bacterium]